MTSSRRSGSGAGTRHEVPDLVDAYVRRCVRKRPRPAAGTIVLTQSGEMRLGPGRPWMPFTAEQTIAASQTGFTWTAQVRMSPLVNAVVVDAYHQGRGRLDARLWGILPVAHARGPRIDRGEAQRYLAELAWCPAALVDNPEIRFRVLADDVVRAWVVDEETHVDLLFDGEGDIVGATTTTRPRGDLVQPWQGAFSDFRDFAGIRAPSRGEVWWQEPKGRFVYWRGEVTSLAWSG